MKNRVVVTGMGIISPIGNTKEEVVHSLRHSLSGIQFVPEMGELGYRCQVAGRVKPFDADRINKRALQTMSHVARYATLATLEALEDAGLDLNSLNPDRTGVVIGTGAGSINELTRAEISLRTHRKPARLGMTGAAKINNSTGALNLATWLGVKGRCYSVSSACATGVDSIGHGFELIRHGLIDLCICGGAEEDGIRNFWGFMDSLSSLPIDFNDRPEEACRPYDRDRQGLVLSEGAGVLILESLEHAQRRGVRIYAEILSYASSNDGDDMFVPNGRGLRKCIQEALTSAVRIDYINPHGAATQVGDPIEVKVIREIFGDPSPLVSSTKGLAGHAMGAAGAQEAIYSLLMLHHGFAAPTANLDHVDPQCAGIRHVDSLVEVSLETILTFNAGLGGSNACLIFTKT